MDKRELAFNFKAIMMFEKLSGVSYFDLTDENYVFLIYAMYMVKHPYTYMQFMDFIKIFGNNKKVTKQMITEFGEYMEYLKQYSDTTPKTEEKDEGETEEKTKQTITDIVAYLITSCGIDPHYVMYEMELWEIEPYMKCAERKKKEELESERLWTYLNISPHIDTKKCKSPEKLIPFPWEKEEQKIKQNQELENNRFAITNMIGKNIFGEPIETTEKDEG